MAAQKLATISVEKPWGMTKLPEPFTAETPARIGEIWFQPRDEEALLVKYLFTSERLSIQVHPSDEDARARGLPAGKEECWYILHAEPGASIGIGAVRPLDVEALRAAANSGEIEKLIQWHAVETGMFFHIPAGTIHAIGGGISLVEIQQNSDITYRLYDYGRPRELNIDDGAAVAFARPMAAKLRRRVDPGISVRLLESGHLGIAHVVANDLSLLTADLGPMTIVPLAGTVEAAGVSAGPGECLWIDDIAALAVSPDARFLAAWHRS